MCAGDINVVIIQSNFEYMLEREQDIIQNWVCPF